MFVLRSQPFRQPQVKVLQERGDTRTVDTPVILDPAPQFRVPESAQFGDCPIQMPSKIPITKYLTDVCCPAFGLIAGRKPVSMRPSVRCTLRGLNRKPIKYECLGNALNGLPTYQTRIYRNRFASSGLITPPCGVPAERSNNVPSGNWTGAFNQRSKYKPSQRSGTCFHTARIMSL